MSQATAAKPDITTSGDVKTLIDNFYQKVRAAMTEYNVDFRHLSSFNNYLPRGK